MSLVKPKGPHEQPWLGPSTPGSWRMQVTHAWQCLDHYASPERHQVLCPISNELKLVTDDKQNTDFEGMSVGCNACSDSMTFHHSNFSFETTA